MRLRLLTGQVTHVLKGQVTRLLLLVDDLDEAEREAERAFEHGDPTAGREAVSSMDGISTAVAEAMREVVSTHHDMQRLRASATRADATCAPDALVAAAPYCDRCRGGHGERREVFEDGLYIDCPDCLAWADEVWAECVKERGL